MFQPKEIMAILLIVSYSTWIKAQIQLSPLYSRELSSKTLTTVKSKNDLSSLGAFTNPRYHQGSE